MLIFLSFIWLVGGLIAPQSVLAVESPADPPPANETPPVETPSSCARQVCLGSLNENICTELKGSFDKTSGICRINRGEFKLVTFLGAIIKGFLLKAALAISVVLIIFAGILYLTSGSDPGKANLAKDIIFTTLAGLAFLFFAEIILSNWLGSQPVNTVNGG